MATCPQTLSPVSPPLAIPSCESYISGNDAMETSTRKTAIGIWQINFPRKECSQPQRVPETATHKPEGTVTLLLVFRDTIAFGLRQRLPGGPGRRLTAA